mgnify:FL=1
MIRCYGNILLGKTKCFLNVICERKAITSDCVEIAEWFTFKYFIKKEQKNQEQPVKEREHATKRESITKYLSNTAFPDISESFSRQLRTNFVPTSRKQIFASSFRGLFHRPRQGLGSIAY